jgi:hypothetical protein
MRALILSLILLAASVPALAASSIISWKEVAAESSVTVSPGSTAPIPVLSFRADIIFEPEQFSSGHITLYADLTPAFLSPEAFTPEMRQNLAVVDSFGAGASLKPGPGTAVIKSIAIRRQGGNSFVMDALVGMNGRQKAVQIPFTAAISSYFDLPKLQIDGTFDFSVNDFATATLKAPANVDKVNVVFKIVAIPAQAK